MIQGESVEKEFTIYNIQNYTINGTLIEKILMNLIMTVDIIVRVSQY